MNNQNNGPYVCLQQCAAAMGLTQSEAQALAQEWHNRENQRFLQHQQNIRDYNENFEWNFAERFLTIAQRYTEGYLAIVDRRNQESEQEWMQMIAFLMDFGNNNDNNNGGR